MKFRKRKLENVMCLGLAQAVSITPSIHSQDGVSKDWCALHYNCTIEPLSVYKVLAEAYIITSHVKRVAIIMIYMQPLVIHSLKQCKKLHNTKSYVSLTSSHQFGQHTSTGARSRDLNSTPLTLCSRVRTHKRPNPVRSKLV